ncbi:MAG: hypothetical protein ACLPVJ_14055, partial [Syntrophobacteraceae bacterium]
CWGLAYWIPNSYQVAFKEVSGGAAFHGAEESGILAPLLSLHHSSFISPPSAFSLNPFSLDFSVH